MDLSVGATMESVYYKNYIVSVETGAFEEHLPLEKSTVIRFYLTKNFYSATSPMDHIGDRLYKDELGLGNDTVNSYLMSYNTDGSGVRILKKSKDYFTVEFHGNL